MRREVASIVAAAVSVLPGLGIAQFGDGAAQYGMTLVIAAFPLYCAGTGALIYASHCAVARIVAPTLGCYLLAGALISAAIAAVLYLGDAGIVAALAGGATIFAAFALTPLFERPHGKRAQL